MTRTALIWILLTIFIYSCVNKSETSILKASFKSIEISYSDGWTKSFSFLADSNKIYFLPQDLDKTYYGIMPDSIFKSIDSIVYKIINARTIHSKDNNCEDCPIVAIRVVSKIDTTQIIQSGDIDLTIEKVIKSLQSFIDSGSHKRIKTTLHLETRSIVKSMPPDFHEINFMPPKRKKNGR